MDIVLTWVAAFAFAAIPVAPALIVIVGTCKPWKRHKS